VVLFTAETVLFIAQAAARGIGPAGLTLFPTVECDGDQRNVINETSSETAVSMKGWESAALAGAAHVGGYAGAPPDKICPPRSGTFPRHYAEAA
jgi:hypothetical protein